MPASTRTPAGYRVYGQQTLDRLAFIARAKQLGCTSTAAALNVQSVTLSVKPQAPSNPPIACTLAPESISGRIEDW